jgi:DHA1 family inner membrane transport protein
MIGSSLGFMPAPSTIIGRSSLVVRQPVVSRAAVKIGLRIRRSYDLSGRLIRRTALRGNGQMPLPLLALFLTAFAIGTAEFVIAGLLPEVSTHLSVTIPTAGYLITCYAIGVAVGGPLLGILTTRMSRKLTLLLLIGTFTAGQGLCALAPNFELLMLARLIVSFAHGAFFGVATIVATNLVSEDKRGSAVALLLAGITIANILGVPAGTAIGNFFGWRATFWAVGALSLLAFTASAWLLPADKAPHERKSNLANEFRVLGRQGVYLSIAIIITTMVGQFALFTYIAPLLITVTGISAGIVPWLLLLFGVGSTLGVFVGGRLTDWKLMPSLIGILLLQAAIYALLGATVYMPVLMAVSVLLWGGSNFAFGAPVQTRILNWANDAPNLASTLIPSAFNVGIAIGAVVGSTALDHGLGYAALPWFGFFFSLTAAGIALVSWNIEKRTTPATA